MIRLKAKEKVSEGMDVANEGNLRMNLKTQGGCGKKITNAIYGFYCHGLYEVIEIPVRNMLSKKCYIKYEKYKKCPVRELKELWYYPALFDMCDTREEDFNPNFYYIKSSQNPGRYL